MPEMDREYAPAPMTVALILFEGSATGAGRLQMSVLILSANAWPISYSSIRIIPSDDNFVLNDIGNSTPKVVGVTKNRPKTNAFISFLSNRDVDFFLKYSIPSDGNLSRPLQPLTINE